MTRIRIIGGLAIAAAATLAVPQSWAGPTACPGHFPSWGAPELRKESLAQKSRELCYGAFAVLHSGLTRTPLWSAEHLTKASVAGARETEQVNEFHAEERLPASERAELSDYALSGGYDRGHMAPSGDMPDAVTQRESFTLANMVPQKAENNRGVWANIESGVRDLVQREGEAYVVTGPAFVGANLQALKGRVIIPTSVWKAVYLPGRGIAGAYVAPNDASGTWEVVSVDALTAMTGIDVFPGLAPAARALAGALPEPRIRQPRPEVVAETRAPGGVARIPTADAKLHVGEYVQACGAVSGSKDIGKALFVNFDRTYPAHSLTAIVWRSNLAAIAGVNLSDGQRLCISGLVKIHSGTAQIEIRTREQITP